MVVDLDENGIYYGEINEVQMRIRSCSDSYRK